ncbi:MAG TPA: hypothetical protein VNI79_05150 [Sphingomicrobium sp.]|nr:hypothetical protein [Sphingomicrobium sp.]
MRPAPPYLGAMAILPPTSSPRAALSDLIAAIRNGDQRDRILGGTLAVLVTIIILIIFFVDSQINTAPPPRLIYVENYAPGRTDAEIIASQKVDQAKRTALLEKRKREFQKLEKRLGL